MKPAWRVAFWVLLVIVVAQGVSIYLGRRALWEANVATANAKAERDRTRHRTAGDVMIAERLAMQLRVELAASMRQKGQTDHALVRIQVERDSLRRELAGNVIVDTTRQQLVIEAALDARDTMGVFVATRSEVMGVRPASALTPPAVVVAWHLEREPLQLDVGLSCRGHDAVAQVGGPRWAPITLREVKQSAAICNPPPAWRPFAFEVPSLPWAAGLVGLGYILNDILR